MQTRQMLKRTLMPPRKVGMMASTPPAMVTELSKQKT